MQNQRGLAPLIVIIAVVLIGGAVYAIVPRSILKEYFEKGDKPTQKQFESLIDSAANLTDDRDLIGLKEYNPAQEYKDGDTTSGIKENPLYKDTSPTPQNPLADKVVGGTKYANGILPLGDKKYTTTGPKKGYVYLCNARSGGGGAQADGPWIVGNTWLPAKKISIQGSVSWPNANFSVGRKGDYYVVTGNGLPIDHVTGNYPVASTDPAYQYDRNPNSIKSQTLSLSLPASPAMLSTPACMGGEVGIMLSGVPLFNAFDAELRDAAAHEVQDSCEGHPQISGEYHYHSLSSCFKDTSVSTVLGYALDGFPITGPSTGAGTYLTTDDLDECHGMTSEIVVDGKKTKSYHYVMTMDFPYSVSCFKAKPVSLQVMTGGGQASELGQLPGSGMSQSGAGSTGGFEQAGPPQEAINACSGKSAGAICSFSDTNGSHSGTCGQVPEGMVCMPR